MSNTSNYEAAKHLWENKGSLTKYIAKLKELMEKDEQSEARSLQVDPEIKPEDWDEWSLREKLAYGIGYNQRHHLPLTTIPKLPEGQKDLIIKTQARQLSQLIKKLNELAKPMDADIEEIAAKYAKENWKWNDDDTAELSLKKAVIYGASLKTNKAETGLTVQQINMKYKDPMTWEEERKHLPSLWQIGDTVSVIFPGSGHINEAKVIKVSFDERDAYYDVDVKYMCYAEGSEEKNVHHARIHGLKEWHLRQVIKDEVKQLD